MRTLRIPAALIVAFCIGLTACGGGGGSHNTTPPPPPTLSSIAVSSTGSTVVVGMTLQMKAEGKYSDGSTKDMTSSVTWSSSDTNIATVSATGLVTGVGSGTVNIKAASGSVSNQSAVSVNKPAITSVAVSASSTTVPLGASQQIVATATYENNTTGPITEGVTWASSDTSVFAVDAAGLATAKASTGTAAITAAAGGKTSAPVTLTAAAAAPKSIMIYLAVPSIAINQWVQPATYLIYTDGVAQDVSGGTTLSVADSNILTLTSPTVGTIVGKAAGSTKLNASYQTMSASTDVTVSGDLTGLTVAPKTATLHQGGEVLFTASGSFDNGTTQNPLRFVVWSSDNPAGADFTGGGVLVGKAAGAVQVTGGLGDFTDTASATVDSFTRQSVEISPNTVDMAVHVTEQLKMEGTFSDGSNTEIQTLNSVQWASSDSTVAAVDRNGLVLSINPGTATITATLPDGTQKTATVNVAHGTMDTLEITADNSNPKVGDIVNFKAIVHLTDGRTFDVTPVAIWQSPDPETALIDAKGKLIARKVGTLILRVFFDGAFTKTVTIAPAQ